jgi:hypothetical protein
MEIYNRNAKANMDLFRKLYTTNGNKTKLDETKKYFNEQKFTREEFLNDKKCKEIFSEACYTSNLLVVEWLCDEFRICSDDTIEFLSPILTKLLNDRNQHMMVLISIKYKETLEITFNDIIYSKDGKIIGINDELLSPELLKKQKELETKLNLD